MYLVCKGLITVTIGDYFPINQSKAIIEISHLKNVLFYNQSQSNRQSLV